MPLKKVKIALVWGLPGSGKSTWAKKLIHEWSIVDMDHIMRRGEHERRNAKLLRGAELIHEVTFAALRQVSVFGRNKIIIDGLIINNAFAKELLASLSAMLEAHLPKIKIEYSIHWWALDRPTCIYNDNNRRKISSRMTIKNAPFEEPSEDLLKAFEIKECVRHTVKRKSEFEAWMHLLGFSSADQTVFSSNRWATGGEVHNCHGDIMRVRPEDSLGKDQFLEFNQVVMNVPEEYHQVIWDASVTTESFTDSDYYGGFQYYEYYEICLKKCYDKFLELGFVKKKENTLPI